MRSPLTLGLVLFAACHSRTQAPKMHVARVPLRFEENRGQFDAPVRFIARERAMTLSLTAEGAVVALPSNELRMRVHDQLPTAQLQARQLLVTRSNYFVGNDPKSWRTDVPNFGEVVYRGVRPGVDLVYHGSKEGRIEYDFTVAPGASPDVTLDVEGAERLEVARDGTLEVYVGQRILRQPPPVVFQEQGGKRHELAGAYRVVGKARVGFVVAKYDPARPLVIDPTLLYSTYLGGGGDDEVRAMAMDASGAVYLCGSTSSANYPVATPLQAAFGGGVSDVIVTKLTAAGDALAWSTYLGGGGEDFCRGVAVDANGAAYVTGFTSSANFPMGNPFDSTFGGLPGDAFVAKLAPAGDALVYSTYLGGTGDETAYAVAVDGTGAAYVTGFVGGGDFPVANAFQATSPSGQNGFVTKLAPDGSALAYSTYLGGTGINGDQGNGIAVDTNGSAYVTGVTSSADFPIVGAFQATMRGTQDAFVTKFTPAGNALAYSTYLGGGGASFEFGNHIAVDASGSAYVIGDTAAADFPVVNGYQRSFGGGSSDAFIAKLTPAGDALVYATYLGGNNEDHGWGLAVDGSGAAYVIGYTLSTNFPVAGGFQTAAGGGGDAFVARLSPAGNALSYASYLGGAGLDYGFGVAVDASGAATVAGFTESTNFPTVSALQATAGGGRDCFVAKISAPLSIAPSSPMVPPRGMRTFSASGGSGAGYTWSLPTNASGGSIDAATSAYTAGAMGGVTDVAQVVDSASNTAMVSIMVGPGVSIQPSSATARAGERVGFAAMGGSGSGYVWSVAPNASGGAIDGATGAYTAGVTPGVDTVHVVDSLGNVADATVTVAASGMPDAGGGNPAQGDGGCGCRIAGAGDSSMGTIALLLVVLVGLLRMRGRSATWQRDE